MQRQTIRSLAETHLAMRTRQRFAASTLKCERSTTGKLARWWDKTRRAPSSLGEAEMEEFLYGADGLAEHVSPATFNTQLAQLRQFAQWMIRRDVWHPAVLDAMRPMKTEGKDYLRLPLTRMATMVATTEDPYDRFVLEFLIQSLGREGELLTRQWRHIDLDSGRIEWRRNKVGHTVNGSDYLPITADLDRAIRAWVVAYQDAMHQQIQPDWYIIPSRDGNGVYTVYEPAKPRYRLGPIVQEHVARVAPGVDLKGQGAHIIRRSAARALYEALLEQGEPDPLRIVQAMLGHASVVTTERYLGIRKDREKRDQALAGRSPLSVSTENVIRLEAVG